MQPARHQCVLARFCLLFWQHWAGQDWAGQGEAGSMSQRDQVCFVLEKRERYGNTGPGPQAEAEAEAAGALAALDCADCVTVSDPDIMHRCVVDPLSSYFSLSSLREDCPFASESSLSSSLKA